MVGEEALVEVLEAGVVGLEADLEILTDTKQKTWM
jgi:hypothetical protein